MEQRRLQRSCGARRLPRGVLQWQATPLPDPPLCFPQSRTRQPEHGLSNRVSMWPQQAEGVSEPPFGQGRVGQGRHKGRKRGRPAAAARGGAAGAPARRPSSANRDTIISALYACPPLLGKQGTAFTPSSLQKGLEGQC